MATLQAQSQINTTDSPSSIGPLAGQCKVPLGAGARIPDSFFHPDWLDDPAVQRGPYSEGASWHIYQQGFGRNGAN